MNAVDLGILPMIPRDEEGPVFREPWEAQAFALTLRLHEQGLFGWEEWSEALAAEIAAARARGEPDLGDTYYRHWLAALEKLAVARGLTQPGELAERKEAWARAYRETPHGMPVQLPATDTG